MTILEALKKVTESIRDWVSDTKADVSAGTYAIVATTDDGVAYTATVPGITKLTAGASFIMIPGSVSTSTQPTLNVNELGVKIIRRRLSHIPTSLHMGYSESWLTADKPFRVIYDGDAWIVEGHPKPSASDLYGAVVEAKKATNDSDDQKIVSTYIKDLSVSSNGITCVRGDNTVHSVSLNELIHSLLPKVTNITLNADAWLSHSAPYHQDIVLDYVTETSKVDIQPTGSQLSKWQNEGIAFTTLSLAGSVRVYVTDIKPSEDITVQITVQEVLEV